MQFTTKDLMITVLPRVPAPGSELARVCLWQTRICTAPTFWQNRGFADGGTTICLATILNTCPRTWSLELVVISDREDLVALRAELQDTLAQLAELEKTVPSGLRSKNQAEQLQHGLKDVIEQIRKNSKTLP